MLHKTSRSSDSTARNFPVRFDSFFFSACMISRPPPSPLGHFRPLLLPPSLPPSKRDFTRRWKQLASNQPHLQRNPPASCWGTPSRRSQWPSNSRTLCARASIVHLILPCTGRRRLGQGKLRPAQEPHLLPAQGSLAPTACTSQTSSSLCALHWAGPIVRRPPTLNFHGLGKLI